MCAMWLPAVFGDITSRSAICLLECPLGRECEHFDLASGQPRRPLAAASHAMPGGTKHGVYSVAVEPAGPDLVPQ